MKKFLSMVLTLAMAMSFLTFAAPTAGAKSFSDVTDANYKEAIEVISAIEVMDGYADASFGPSSTLTRQAAAKITCNMILGPTTAKALPTNVNPFPDVQAGGEFAGYISYCADNGIISGYADGTFQPTGSLSGYAFLKMLLGALGYDAKIEGYVGANWKVNVAKQALGIGLDSGLREEMDASKTVTREEAALYMFNTLKSDLVDYGDKITTQVGEAVVTIGNQRAAALRWPTNSSTADGNIDSVGGDGYTQFAEQYFNKLQRRAARADSFGRPATRWDWKGVEIGTYKETVQRTYHDNMKIYEMYNDMNMPGSDDRADLFVNGVHYGTVEFKRSNDNELNDYTKRGTALRRNVDRSITNVIDETAGGDIVLLNDGIIGNGTVTEVFRDDDNNHVTLCVISQYAGKVTSVKKATDKKNAYVVVEAFGAATNGKRPVTFNNGDNNEFETTAFSTDDVVVYTYSDDGHEIKDMARLSSVEGSVTRRVVDESVTLSGTTYKYAQNFTFDDGVSQDSLTNNSDFVAYLDSNGYALFIENAEFAVDYYAVLTAIETHKGGLTYTFAYPGGDNNEATSWNDNRAHLIFTDGTEHNVYLDGAYVNSNTNRLQSWLDGPSIVRYRVDSNGDYKLYEVPERNQAYSDSFRISNRESSERFTSPSGGTVYVSTDSKTVFVIQRGDDFRVYTGIRNAPNVNANGDGDYGTTYVYYTVTDDENVAKLVVVRGSTDVVTQSKDITFLSGKSASKEVTADDMSNYRVYNAVVAGNIQEVWVRYNANLNGVAINDADDVVQKAYSSIMLNVTNYDNDDLLESGSFTHATVTAHNAIQGIKTTGSSNEVRIGGRTLTLANNVAVYFCYDNGDIEKISVNDIETDEDDYAYYTLDDGDVTNLFICEYETPANPAPLPLSADNTIATLSYSVNNANPVELTNLQKSETQETVNGETIYSGTVTVTLPADTPADAAISLTATANEENAEVSDIEDVVLVNGAGQTHVIIEAENGIERDYTINLTTAAA